MKKKTKFCEVCDEDILVNEMRNVPMYQDSRRRRRVKEYCKDHEGRYNDHKCKPQWCKGCGFLIKYIIEIDFKESPRGTKKDKKISEQN